MNSIPQKIIIDINDNKHSHWELALKSELKNIKSNTIEIDCKNLDLSCENISKIIQIASNYDCEILSFSSSSLKTIISAQSLGYGSQFIAKNYSNYSRENIDRNSICPKTHFHQGTVRSGEYLDIPGDLLILGDVNPGAVVRAEKNIIIWGRLLGIAHAGCKGNSQATISALQLWPLQLRISNKVARGPKEKPQLGLAEQAKIDSEKIIISPLDYI